MSLLLQSFNLSEISNWVSISTIDDHAISKYLAFSSFEDLENLR